MGDTIRDGFARQMAIVLRVAGGRDIEYDATDFLLRFRLPNGAPMVANLANVFVEWGREPQAERSARMRQFAEMLVNTDDAITEWEAVADRLRPVLNSPQLAHGGPIFREFLPFVCEMVVIDHPDKMQYVTMEDPPYWGVSDADVFTRARANLAARAMWPDVGEPRERSAVLRMVESGNDYWASHLVLDGWLASMGGQVGGRPVVFVPDRSTGLTVLADRPDGIAPLLEMAEKDYLKGTRAVSPQGYTVDDSGRVVPYSVPTTDPLWNAVRRSETILAEIEYNAWKDANDANLDLEPSGYIAKFQVGTRDADGSLYSLGVWGDNLVTLLPKTDYVAVVDASHRHVVVPFDTLVREVGLVAAPDLYPPRYPTPPRLTERQLGALRAAAVQP